MKIVEAAEKTGALAAKWIVGPPSFGDVGEWNASVYADARALLRACPMSAEIGAVLAPILRSTAPP